MEQEETGQRKRRLGVVWVCAGTQRKENGGGGGGGGEVEREIKSEEKREPYADADHTAVFSLRLHRRLLHARLCK